MISNPSHRPLRYATLMLTIVCALSLSGVAAFAELTLIGSKPPDENSNLLGHLRTFDHNGQIRTARVIFPTAAPKDPNPVYPVVFWLHGTTPDATASDFYFNGFYDGELGQKFVAVIPHGSPPNNQSGKFGWNHAPINGASKLPGGGIYDYDDIGFLYELCQRLYKEPRIQNGKKGFYFIGHSAGGFMAQRMAMVCEATQGLSPSGSSIHVPSSLTRNHQPLQDVSVQHPVPHTRKTGYPEGTQYGGLLIRPETKRYLFNLPMDRKVRYVHVNGECDPKALWGGNMPPGEGNLPDDCFTAPTWTQKDAETSGMPFFPILKAANTWADWNGGQTASWTVEDGIIHDKKGTAFSYRSYFKPISPSTTADDVWVIRLKETAHGGPAFIAMKELRLKLLLGQEWQP